MIRRFARRPAVIAAACLCGCAASVPEIDSITVSDESNGFILTLTVSPRSPKAGAVVNAVATLENTTDGDVAVHVLNICPQYLRAGEGNGESVIVPDDGWRTAYSAPALEGAGEGGEGGFLDDVALFRFAPDAERIKKECVAALGPASFGDFYPTDVVIEHSKIIMSASFTATPGRNWIDTGLFCLESFYSKHIWQRAREARRPAWNPYDSIKFLPGIWLGSLYVGVEVEVE